MKRKARKKSMIFPLLAALVALCGGVLGHGIFASNAGDDARREFVSAERLALSGPDEAPFPSGFFNGQVRIKSEPDGYLCVAPGGESRSVSALSEIFDAGEKSDAAELSFYFEKDFVATERLAVKGKKPIELAGGTVEYSGEAPFITMRGKALALNGLTLHSNVCAVRVESGIFRQNTGEIVLSDPDAEPSPVTKNAVMLMGGKAEINGRIEFKSAAPGGTSNFGIALRVDNADAVVGEHALILGPTAVSLLGGPLTITGGRIEATASSSQNAAAGHALDVLEQYDDGRHIFLRGGTLVGNGGAAVNLAGNRAVLEYSGGTVEGKIKLNRGCASEIKLGGRTVRATDRADVVVDPEGDGAIEAATAEIYEFQEWRAAGSGALPDNPADLAAFAENAEITPVAKRRQAHFVVDGKDAFADYAFIDNEGRKIDYPGYLSAYADLTPEYFEIIGWDERLPDGTEREFPHEAENVCANRVYEARLGIKNPKIALREKYEFEYRPEGYEIIPELSVPPDYSHLLSYRWLKGKAKVCDAKILTVANASDSGTYTFKVGRDLDSASQRTIAIEIRKAVVSVSDAPEMPKFSGKYIPGKRLCDGYGLPDGVRWADPSEVPSASKKEYDALYNPDGANFEDLALKARIDLARAEYDATYVWGKIRTRIPLKDETGRPVAYYGKPLSGYAHLLSPGCRWKAPDAVPTCADFYYDILFNEDPDNFVDFATTFELRLNKGIPEDPQLRIELGYEKNLTFGAALSRLPRQYRYAGERKASDLLFAGEYSDSAIYNPDKDNFADLETTFVAIVAKATYDMSSVKFESKTFVYDGTEHALAISGAPPEGVAVAYAGNARTNAGTQEATAAFAVPDALNYNPIEPMKATLTVEKATYDMSNVKFESKTFVYDGTEHALAISGAPPEGASVAYAGNARTNAGTQEATAAFAVPDALNYNPIEPMKATLTIEKATYDMSSVRFEDKTVEYDGTEHSLEIGGELPEGLTAEITYGGENRVGAGTILGTARFVADENHKAVPDMTATLTVEKATYDMSSVRFEDKTVTYDGTEHSLEIGGELPEGLTAEITYGDENRVGAGTIRGTARFVADENHKAVPDMTATLTVEKATYDMSSVKFEDETFIYDGTEHALAISGAPPEGVAVEYAGNARTNAGTQEAMATFVVSDASNYNFVEPKKAILTVEKAPAEIAGKARQSRLCDGAPKEIEFEIMNSEQADPRVKYGDSDSAPTETGTYRVVVRVAESDNFRAGERAFVLNVNETRREIKESETVGEGETALSGFVDNEEIGVDNDSEICLKMGNVVENGFDLILEMSNMGETSGEYRVSARLPERWRGNAYEAVFVDADGTETPTFAREAEGFLSFCVAGPGRVRLREIGAGEAKALPWWAWLSICAGAAILCGQAALVGVALKRRMKSEKDKA